MLAKITSFWDAFVDILFPRPCTACRQLLAGTESHLCTSCLVSLPRLLPGGLFSEQVELKFVAFGEVKMVCSFLVYQPKGRVQALLRNLKYENNPELGVFLGRLCASEWRTAGKLPMADVLVPVPLHPKKRNQRGYNQAECFAQGFSEETGIPVDGTLLRRDLYTESQTRKTRTERIAAMQGVFSLRTGTDATKLRIALVDDVLTTGATLEGCTETLVRGGCHDISIITIAAALS